MFATPDGQGNPISALGGKGGDRFFGGLIGYTDIFPSQYRYKRYLVLPISVQSISSDTNIDNVVRYRYQYQYR